MNKPSTPAIIQAIFDVLAAIGLAILGLFK